jgi:hypothetical protein
MKLEIKNKITGNSATVGEYNNIRQELVRALAAYMIDNDLVEIELKRGALVATVDIVKKVKNNENEKCNRASKDYSTNC